MTLLDTRKERPLTSREICKIISGALCGAVQAGAEADAVLELLRGLQITMQGQPPVDRDHPSAIPIPDPAWCGTIGGLLGGLSGWCQPEDIDTAIDWICGHWGDLMATVAATALQFGGQRPSA